MLVSLSRRDSQQRPAKQVPDAVLITLSFHAELLGAIEWERIPR